MSENDFAKKSLEIHFSDILGRIKVLVLTSAYSAVAAAGATAGVSAAATGATAGASAATA